MSIRSYLTQGGILVRRRSRTCSYRQGNDALIARLDRQRGLLLSSSYEYPGRYTRWDLGFIDPPLSITTRGHHFRIDALNARGRVLLTPIANVLRPMPELAELQCRVEHISGRVQPTADDFPEEQRSRQPSVFSLLRRLIALFASPQDEHLGFYGAFGYDLVFQFEPMPLTLERPADQRDLLLYLPDRILLTDHQRQETVLLHYDFSAEGVTTRGLPRRTVPAPYQAQRAQRPPAPCDHEPGEFGELVQRARQAFARGDLFEAVVGQMFSRRSDAQPSEIFRRLRASNPAPYGALINLGEGEFLVSASPEMFVRVDGRRIETCPISGTIARGRDALEDAANIRTLLNSHKDEAELTMCTDVDRNDKSRVCEPGSVRVLGRRQIELYSRLIHTVDHVEGRLRPEFDALDGFLSHAWAVTVTGAPKRGAIRFIEQHERSPRRWYGGALGGLLFNGNMNTGLTLRTFRLKDGIAEVRAGATLLYHSDPVAEEAETRLKASALLAVLEQADSPAASVTDTSTAGLGKQVLLIDHEDSFVHTLAGYLRSTGAAVQTLRAPLARAKLQQGLRPDLVVLSPGPGCPDDFAMRATLDLLIERGVPVFGVCLGLQGIVEYFGGQLGQLAEPAHGIASKVRVLGGRLFAGLPGEFSVGRYHSLFGRRDAPPQELIVTAETEDGVVMAIEHCKLPIAAVQFHPESVLTPAGEIGLPLIEALLTRLA